METIAVLLSLVSILSLSLACSPEGYQYRTTVQRVYDSPIVLYGKILRHLPSDVFTQPWEDVYTAEMQVHCVIKGPQDLDSRPVVNISEAGFVPGFCHATDLTVGKSFIVTLRESGDESRPLLIPDETQIAADKLDEVAKACGLTPFTPQGSAPDMCPSPAGPGECEADTRPTETVRPEMPSPPPPPKGGAEPSEKKDIEKDEEFQSEDAGAVHGKAASASFSVPVVMTTIYLMVTLLL